MSIDNIMPDLIQKITDEKVDTNEIIDTLIENKIFLNKRSALLFLLESVFSNQNNFNVVFPIAYYTSEEEGIEDNGDYSWEGMNDEFIKELEKSK